MLSVNLLPVEQKSESSRRKLRSLVANISRLLAVVLFAIAAFLYFVTNISQANRIEELQDATDTALIQLQGEPEIDKLLTLQNQLTSIPQLHNSKAVSSRLFDYLDKIVPEDVTLTDVSLDFTGTDAAAGGGDGLADPAGPGLEEPVLDELVRLPSGDDVEIVFAQAADNNSNQIMMSGITRDFKSLNTFVDILKNAEFSVKSNVDLGEGVEPVESEIKNAFKNVKTNSASPQDSVTLSFALTFNYDPQLFDFSVTQITFSVPSKITTVSEQERPTGLFIDDPFDDEEEEAL